MNTKILGVLILILILGGIAFGASSLSPKNSVLSTNNNSDFNPTPADTGKSEPNPDSGSRVAAGYVTGHISIGPNCPVERVDEPCPPSPEAYSSRKVIVYDADGSTVNVTGKIDSKGNYNIPLGPGKYFIQIQPAGIGAGEKKPVTIKSWETGVVDFDIDTGIR
jgi:hypothetical protein